MIEAVCKTPSEFDLLSGCRRASEGSPGGC